MHGKRTRRATVGASIAILVASFGWAQPIAAGAADPVPLVAPPVVVTIGFDDGTADQFGALQALNDHHMHATFFINSGFIGDPDHLSEEQLGLLAAAGNEIGGHTVDHANIQPLSDAEATAEVCDDRATLMGLGATWGFTVTSFAYPFGSYDANSETIVKSCGYDSARTVSGVSIHVAKDKIGETLPPLDPYATRTPPNAKKATKLSTMEQYVLNAEAAATGESLWIQFVFHRYCDAHCGAYTVQPAKFAALLDFLQAETLAGRVSVQTTAEAMAG